MIAVDTNILVYAHREETSLHLKAKEKLIQLAEGDLPWSIPVTCLTEFLRIISHPKIFDPPYEASKACEALHRLLEIPSLQILYPSTQFPALLEQVMRKSQASGNLVFDAQIVTLCLENGVTQILTNDHDFRRFKEMEFLEL